ncbi:hypothetical protein BO70DRAFT_339332 [Aspergillus heteromorphus CBS 117.55]|uniref:Synaptobrevin n=1 Tax=Aspergillus heteromorphus CBS 117.55 TaxID=1448321 RepID=A0A317VX76_9EURO|nr:uncharacterized protein BO70DRAFT_339332 [Aspergillus heteromorphus CBS 117.55]PWY77498.1 hypothetical protein BO70DRAFT_339332 [Aspergillus heteromorphus CBS 117.55]
MTLTTYASPPDPSDIATLNLSRLFARLEHNLLSSAADLKPLRHSEHQRMRVGANIEYARTNLQILERSLPQIKPLDRRNDLQTDLAQKRQILKRLQTVLDELAAEAAARPTRRADGIDNDDDTEEEGDSLIDEDLLGTPEEGSTTDGLEETEETEDQGLNPEDEEERAISATATLPSLASPTITTTTTEVPPSPPVATATPTPPPPSSTLRNRSNVPTTSPLATATATGASVHDAPSSPQHPSSPSPTTEDALSSDRAEQEDLTSSLLALATQLKSSSQAFHSSLESEKSILSRAADGLDRTTGNMQAAERRMGMLRRMTEGKGWWGRMMLYAWIFGLWIVAILIVFLGPKLRF